LQACLENAIVNRPYIIVSPYSLGREAPGLRELGGADRVLNAPGLPDSTETERIGVIHRGLAAEVAAARARGRPALSIAADCLQTAGVLAGLRRAGLDPLIVWLDAHGDFNTPETTVTGFIGGMPLAMLVGRGESWLRDHVDLAPVAERDVLLCDARDLDPGEAALLRESDVTIVGNVGDLAARAPAGRPVYVHFDVDIIDASETPAVTHPVAGGPSTAAVCEMAAALARTRDIVAVSMTTWRLSADVDGRTERASQAVLDALLGEGQ
jgi:arginase